MYHTYWSISRASHLRSASLQINSQKCAATLYEVHVCFSARQSADCAINKKHCRHQQHVHEKTFTSKVPQHYTDLNNHFMLQP
jgi:hypothetical protein